MSQMAAQVSPVIDIADQVRDFYERYPYPPPVDDLEKYQRLWKDRQRRRADFHLFWPSRPYSEDQSVLIAGCGTSQAAKHAMRWPAAQVVGIDTSATSVRCTEDLKKKYNLTNLRVYQLAIEHINELELSFDQVVCTGVLHHLADPDAGLTALRNVLKPDGAMHLMVYATYGRIGVYMLQEFCRRVGIHATDAEIRALVGALKVLPAGHPLETLLRQAPDFRHKAALADALLHPRDRAYSVPQLFELLAKADLTFGRWIRQAPYSLHCGVIAKIPQAPQIASLPIAEQYAAIELFRGTIARHSLVAYRNQSERNKQLVTFAGDEWLDYVPIRMSDVVCVQDHLPSGAAAVLINQPLTFKDLFLPVGPTEKRWFDLIDGDRSIRTIVEETLSSSNRPITFDAAHFFFERMWWHDLVVFDRSHVPSTVRQN